MTEQERKRNRTKAAKLKPKPQELPSGQWRCQVTVGGKRLSFTDDDPVIAHDNAVAARAGYLQKSQAGPTMKLGSALDLYIERKEAVLSPTTIRAYRQIRRLVWEEIENSRLCDIHSEDAQRVINAYLKTHSVKSAKNAAGLLSAAVSMFSPEKVIRIEFPQRLKPDIRIPTTEDIAKVLAEVKGRREELPIMLGAYLGLRMSEIRGLTWDCIEGGRLHVKQAKVYCDSGDVVKATKTYSSDRWLTVPAPIKTLLDATPRRGEYIVTLGARQIYGRFSAACERAGVQHYRFHDLRHYNASVMLSMGVPDKYAMERMGHATNNMLKTVYQHTIDQKQREIDSQLENFFETKLHTNCT